MKRKMRNETGPTLKMCGVQEFLSGY